MKKWTFILGGIIILAFVAIIAFNAGTHYKKSDDKSEVISASYGDNLSGVNLIDEDGNAIGSLFEAIKADYKVIFYLSSKCSSCEKSVVTAEHLKAVLDDRRYKVIIVYEDSVPKGLKPGDIDGIYSMGSAELSVDTPTGMILDEKNDVLFSTAQMNTVIEKIMSLESESEVENMRAHANNYLLKNTDANDFRPSMVYFKMNGCPDCKAVEPIITAKSVQEKFKKVELYTDESFGEEDLVDTDEVFRTIFGIDWYPSFELVSESKQIVLGEMSEEKLIDELNHF